MTIIAWGACVTLDQPTGQRGETGGDGARYSRRSPNIKIPIWQYSDMVLYVIDVLLLVMRRRLVVRR